MTLDDRIRVCIRGMSGLLGSRLALAINQQPDMVVTAGICKDDKSLQRLLKRKRKLPPLYLDEKHKVVDRRNAESSLTFLPASQLNLKKTCDVVVDATSPRSKDWSGKYRDFGKPVIMQSGEYPKGTLVAYPLFEEGDGVYRQGDCIMSALAPVLAAYRDVMTKVRVHVVMQYNEYLQDYPTNQRIHSTYLGDELADQLGSELQVLLPEVDVVMEGLLNIPGLDYYTITLHLDTSVPLSARDLGQFLAGTPRVLVTPSDVTSTYEIDHFMREEARAYGKDIPPVVVYGKDFVDDTVKMTDHRIRVTVYSKLVAVLPNVDAIRILASGVDPLTAMEITDRYAGFL